MPTNLIPTIAQPASGGGALPDQWLHGFIEIAKFCVIFVGGYFSHRLLLRRDFLARKRELDLASSDFEVSINKWLERIDDKKEQMVLPTIHAKSIADIEPVMRAVRGHLSVSAKRRLDEAWRDYQRIDRQRLDAVPNFDPVTKCTVPVYEEARKLLSEPLHKVLEAVQET